MSFASNKTLQSLHVSRVIFRVLYTVVARNQSSTSSMLPETNGNARHYCHLSGENVAPHPATDISSMVLILPAVAGAGSVSQCVVGKWMALSVTPRTRKSIGSHWRGILVGCDVERVSLLVPCWFHLMSNTIINISQACGVCRYQKRVMDPRTAQLQNSSSLFLKELGSTSEFQSRAGLVSLNSDG